MLLHPKSKVDFYNKMCKTHYYDARIFLMDVKGLVAGC